MALVILGVALALGAAVIVQHFVAARRPSADVALTGSRSAQHVHPFLRPPALRGQLKSRKVFVDDWRSR